MVLSQALIYFVLYLQDLEPYEQLEKLKQSKSELLLKIAALKQQIVDIETQENEAIREVSSEVKVTCLKTLENEAEQKQSK